MLEEEGVEEGPDEAEVAIGWEFLPGVVLLSYSLLDPEG